MQMKLYKYQQLYRDKVVSEPVPHLFIISDEFAELKTQQPEFMEQLISAARIGRSLGVHLILATQKPSGVVDDQIWSNSKFRVCLKVQEKADSQDMIKCPDAAEISQTGRFYLQVGFNELFALGQSAWCGAEYIPTETVEKSVDNSIQVVDNLGRTMMKVKPNKKKISGGSKTKQIVSIVKYLSDIASEENISVRPLWLDPIPGYIFVDEIENKYSISEAGTTLNPVVGEYDDPFNQKQGGLTIPFSEEGNCLIYGATGNGKTTFLTTLCYALIKNHSAEEVNIYIMDFGSETLKVFDKAPQVGGVIVSSDEEKTINFLKMLHSEMEKRKGLFSEFGGDYAGYCRNSGKTVPNIVVLLNNYSGFSEQFEDLQESFALLTRDGVKYGIYFAVTAGNTNAVRYKTQQNFKMMLTMQLNDATDYSLVVGKTDGLIPSKYKGRGLVCGIDQTIAQIDSVIKQLNKPPIIYRDMKPANVMLKPDGNIKVIDFGIAREYKDQSLADTVSLGTKGYAAPEQFGGKGQTDARTDIYCLGVTLYHLLTGQNPCEPPYEIYPIRHWNPQLSAGLEAIIQKCTQLNPDDRYQSCAELLYALHHYEEYGAAYRAMQKSKLKKFIVTVSAMVICLCVGVFGLLMRTATNNADYTQNILQAEKASTSEEKANYYAISIVPSLDTFLASLKIACLRLSSL